ncbi:type 2 lanthipeptide synthetase LanM family protein [Dyella acidiphila]|uniref:Type 2 lantipeptide synthetase LanM family protein n=1 Tax=Dyella acidiphila TaxID=2775866 RepID=A0ABR9GCL2_9GAMM|nr:type 2 lanthipeptide synthetase LanM family protein [Dyella acidiphila]MBE1161786.1 type 2 lantipeptide synthetase LanM family protein [Dyella acidiphila]
MMAETLTPDAFAPVFEHFTATVRTALGKRLAAMAGLDAGEVLLIRKAADEALRANARLKLNRVLLLELHAANRCGQLTAESDTDRHDQFVDYAQQAEFTDHLDQRYPALHRRLQRSLEQQAGAIEALASRLATDRALLTHFFGRAAGRLMALSLGQGDLHAGGHTVARLSLEAGEIMYKPRSLRVDMALDSFLQRVFGEINERIRVPEVIDRGHYGWVSFVVHRYCEGEQELQAFYLRLGHWLAVLRLLGGTDIHHENLIAAGPMPVVIDAESLFAVIPKPAASGGGLAHDAAQMLIAGSVLRTGIVPFRASDAGFDGADLSAAGALPNQQPKVQIPVIVDAGTTEARLKLVDTDIVHAQNHPSALPQVSAYWSQISEGFLAASHILRDLDASGVLEAWLRDFEGCPVRDLRLPTQTYVELGRMLWHPASLHDEAKAIERARDLFSRNAAITAVTASTPAEISGTIDDLLYGDIPVFVAPLKRSRIDAALADWRAMRIDLEELTIRCALVTTELNRRGNLPDPVSDGRLCRAQAPHAEQLDARRRKLAADVVERLLKLSVSGADGSVTWITPETTTEGWFIQPLQGDIYFGLGGVTVALAGYLREVHDGRANPVPGIEAALNGALHTLTALEAIQPPRNIGGFAGYGAQIWTWLTLRELLQRPELIERAVASAEALEAKGLHGDDGFDIIDGAAGVIVPLLGLADATGDARWLALAARAAEHLENTAVIDALGARWMTRFEQAIGGFSHGATGIGWALARLAASAAGSAADRSRWSALADAAFAFEDSLYEESCGNWIDKRHPELNKSHDTWCNGSVGIGLAAADLYARSGDARHLQRLRRATVAARGKWGISHTLCHGDFSLWELQMRAAALDPVACAEDLTESAAHVISSIEEQRGIVTGRARAAFTPGLMNGLAGAVHGLSRLHPECTLPSPLLLE